LEINPTVSRSAGSGRKGKNAGIKKVYPALPGAQGQEKWGMSKICFHYLLPIVECHMLYIERPYFRSEVKQILTLPYALRLKKRVF